MNNEDWDKNDWQGRDEYQVKTLLRIVAWGMIGLLGVVSFIILSKIIENL